MLRLSCVVLGLALFHAFLFASEVAPAPAASATAWTLSAAQHQKLDKLCDQAIAHGLPDSRNAKLFQGELKIAWKAADKDRNQSVNGLHAKLADGRWLVNVQWLLVPEVTVDDSDMKPIAADALLSVAQEQAKQWWNPSVLDQILPYFSEDERATIKECFDALPVSYLLGNRNSTVPVLHLVRMGVSGADKILLWSMLNGLQNDEVGEFWQSKAAPMQLTASNADYTERMAERQKAVEAKKGSYRVGEPEAAVRHGLYWYFRTFLSRDINAPYVSMPADAAKLGALSVVQDGETLAKDELALLHARVGVAKTAAADAALADRVACWSPPDHENYSSGEDEPEIEESGDLDGEIETTITALSVNGQPVAKKDPAQFSEKDLDALFALILDARASRWIEGFHPRTIGDNALRIIASVIGLDPRSLIGISVVRPWTAAERVEVGAQLQQWWARNKTRPLAEILEQSLQTLDFPAVVTLLEAREGHPGTPLLDKLATLWAKQPPSAVKPESLAELVRLVKSHAGMTATLMSWPVSGVNRPVLVALHALNGDEQPLRAWFDEVLSGKIDKSDELSAAMSELLPIVYARPKPDSLHRLLAVVAAPIEKPLTNAMVQAILFNPYGYSTSRALIQEADQRGGADGDKLEKARAAMQLALYSAMLSNHNPASAELIVLSKQMSMLRNVDGVHEAGEEEKQAKTDDLRVADVAGACFATVYQAFDLDSLREDANFSEDRKLAVSIGADLASRDAQLAALRAYVDELLPACLEAASLPPIAPAAGEPKGEGKPLF
jgi:hypothetical protein